jgi:hypothetical protein
MSPGPGLDLRVCRVKNTFRDGPAPLPEHGSDSGGRDAAKIPGRAGLIAPNDGQAGPATSPAPAPPNVPLFSFWPPWFKPRADSESNLIVAECAGRAERAESVLRSACSAAESNHIHQHDAVLMHSRTPNFDPSVR